jgi:hypothetical protein
MFSCSSVDYLDTFGLLQRNNKKIISDYNNNTYEDIVFVTALSENHIEETHDFICIFAHRFQTRNLLIVYDLGLSPEQAKLFTDSLTLLKTAIRIEYRKFAWHKYPPEIRYNLREYRWKAMIIAVSRKHYLGILSKAASNRYLLYKLYGLRISIPHV